MRRPRLFETKTFVALGMALALPIGAVACSNKDDAPRHNSTNGNNNSGGVTVPNQSELPNTATATQRFQAGDGLWTRPYAIKTKDGVKASVRPFAIGRDGTIFCDSSEVGDRIETDDAESYRVDGAKLVPAPDVSQDQSNLILSDIATNVNAYTADCITAESPKDTAEVWTKKDGQRFAIGGFIVDVVGNGQNAIEPIG
jgi:hypothetical protein